MLLAAGEFVRHAVAVAGEADQFQHLLGASSSFGPVGAGQPEGDVAGDVQVREEGALLGHHADAAVLRRHVDAGAHEDAVAEADGARLGVQESGGDPQEGGLAAAGGAKDGSQRACGHGEFEPAQDRFSGSVGLGEPFDVQFVHVRCLPRRYEGMAASRISVAA